MKAKYILTALALPAIFAACSNEDFESKQISMKENPVLAGRATGTLSIEAVKTAGESGDESDTRVSGQLNANDGINWMWDDANDKIGAVVVDYKANGEIVDKATYPNYAITNYPFAPNITGKASEAKFSTPTAVVDGAYLFYNRYDGNATSRRVIEHEIERMITVKAGTEAGLVQVGTDPSKGGQNFFISPIINMAIADESSIEKPIALKSIYSVFHFRLTTDLVGDYYSKGFKVYKIEMKAMNSATPFARKTTLDPAAIATIQKGLATGANASLFLLNGAVKTQGQTDAQIKTALDLVNGAYSNPANKIGDTSETTPDLVYYLDEPFVFNSKDGQMDLMCIVPSGVYQKQTVTKEYEGNTTGVFHMTVYTSEGTYDSYISANDLTLERGKKYNVTKELIIDGGKTNVNLFDNNAAFNIETTRDYEYAIDYIKNHYRDYGNSSNWKTPVLNITGGVIDVNPGYYFPEFPIIYNNTSGNAVLNLLGQTTYKINPENVIFGAGAKRPVVQIVGQPTSEVIFDKDIKTVTGKTDGTNITAALQLISDAQIIVNEGVTVNFESLNSKTSLLINKKAIVNSATTATAGTVTIKNSEVAGTPTLFNVTADGYTNSATMSIEENAKVLLGGTASNTGNITVIGELNAIVKEFTNKVGGVITVEGYVIENMNNSSRGVANFKNITNEGTLTITKGVQMKGTYGGLMKITGTLTNSGTVNNNGELLINTLANTNKVNLQNDPYALIQITSGGSTGTGSIVLQDPTQYEMFDAYYTGWNSLKNVTGVIEATLTNAQYETVMANHATYAAKPETAWSVLNKITVTGELKLKADMGGRDKDFVLPANASINAQAALTINSLITDGAATGLKGASQVNVNNTVTVKSGDFTIASGTTLFIEQSAATTMLDIKGKLTNNGKLLTKYAKEMALTTVVGAGATLDNNGTIGDPRTNTTVNKYTDTQFAIISAINAEFRRFMNTLNLYECSSNSGSNSDWDRATSGTYKNWNTFVAWVKSNYGGANTYFRINNTGRYFRITSSGSNDHWQSGYTHTPTTLTAGQITQIENDFYVGATNANGDLLINKTNPASSITNPQVSGLQIMDYLKVVTNSGTVNLNSGSKTYGYVKTNSGTVKGDFTEDYKNILEGII